MVTRVPKWASVFALVGVIVGPSLSSAQDPNKAPNYVRGLLELVKIPAVLADLKLTAEQKVRIDAVESQRREASRNMATAIRSPSPEVQAKAINDYKAFSDLAEINVTAALTPTQIERLKQIRMNMVAKTDGATFGLKNREFQAYIELTDAQKAELEAKAAEADGVAQDKIKKLKAEIEKVRLEAREEVLKVLTQEQRKLYLDLVGRPFDDEKPK